MEVLARLNNYLSLAGAYVRLNLNAQWEYRAGFLSQVLAMFINDCVWVLFWVIFFTRFPVLRGWHARDVITLWSLAATGFGLGNAICGNAARIGDLIVQGQLDVWMLYPRSLLPHLILGRMSASAWGDALFGFVVYVIFSRPDFIHLAWFVALTLSIAFLFVGFGVLTQSLSFYLGNAAGLGAQWHNATLSFSTYPDVLFEGGVKYLLYTLVPAGFITYLPVRALRSLSLFTALESLAGTVVILAIGIGVFYHGLRRYESGNLMEMRG